MDKKREWNSKITANLWEKRRRDPLYQFPNELFYTQCVTNGVMAGIDSQPIKSDRYGVFHGTSL